MSFKKAYWLRDKQLIKVYMEQTLTLICILLIYKKKKIKKMRMTINQCL